MFSTPTPHGDLLITGWHSILVDELTPQEHESQNKINFNHTIDDKQLLLSSVSEKFSKIQSNNLFEYYHFVLEDKDEDRRYGVYANGILVELPSINIWNKMHENHQTK